MINDPNLGFTIVECGQSYLAIYLQTAEDTPSEAWAASMVELRELKDRVGDPTGIKVLAVTDGGAPDAMQRRELFSDILEGGAWAAGISTVLRNPIKRGITTAILWINPNFRAFSPAKSSEAFKHLHLQEYEDKILEALARVQEHVLPVETLQLMFENN